MSSVDVGNRVRFVREQAKLNQRDFASRLATSSGRISEIESGKTMPGGDFLLRLNAEFGSEITWVLTGTSAVTPIWETGGELLQQLIDDFGSLPGDDQEVVGLLVAALRNRAIAKGTSKIRRRQRPES